MSNPPPRTGNEELDRSLRNLWEFSLSGKIVVYNQNAEPSLSKNTIALWIDADGGPAYYLVANLDGTQVKVTLT